MGQQADIVIVSYNDLRATLACIDSVRQYTTYPYHIIVVDNHSTDGTVEAINSLPGIHFLALGGNKGYAGGANAGIRAGTGEYIFILNQDILVTPGWLEPLVETLRMNRRIAVVGPKLVTPDGRIAGAGVFGSDRQPNLRGFLEPDRPGLYEVMEPCISVSGACYGIKRSLVPVIGYFDEAFFMYFEETDYSYRARAKGYQVMYCPKSKVFHDMRWEQRDHQQNGAQFQYAKQLFERKWRGGLYTRTNYQSGFHSRASAIRERVPAYGPNRRYRH